MAIVNRDLDVSQQKDWISWSSMSLPAGVTFASGYVQTGVTLYISGPMPYPYVVQSVQALAIGASGAPELAFRIGRVISGGGFTVIAAGISNLVIPNSASYMAVSGFSGLAAPGSTLLNGLRGDVLIASTQGSNTASNQLLINVVVKKTQDVVSHNGVSS